MSRAKKQRVAERRHLREGKGKPGAWTPDTPPRRDGEVEVVAGEIVAYRGWWVWDDPELGAVLYSMYALVPWEGPTLVADGEPRPHEAGYLIPGPRPVGVHALKAPEWMGSDYRRNCHVEGEVALSGKVVVGRGDRRARMITGVSLDGVPLPHGEADRARLMALVGLVNEAPRSESARIAVRILAVYMLLVTGGLTANVLAPMMHPGAALRYAERRVTRMREQEVA